MYHSDTAKIFFGSDLNRNSSDKVGLYMYKCVGPLKFDLKAFCYATCMYKSGDIPTCLVGYLGTGRDR